jgi:Flp pilus assembly secretin CpaC
MNIEEARDFWRIVATPMKVQDLKVGDPAILDDVDHGTRRTVIVTKKWATTEGDVEQNQIEFRDAEPGEVTGPVTTVIVAGR